MTLFILPGRIRRPTARRHRSANVALLLVWGRPEPAISCPVVPRSPERCAFHRRAGFSVADERAFPKRSSPFRSRTCACGGLPRERRRAPLSHLRQATQAPATGLLRQVPTRCRGGSADEYAVPSPC